MAPYWGYWATRVAGAGIDSFPAPLDCCLLVVTNIVKRARTPSPAVGLFSLRKAFTVSERVAIAEAVAERLRGRHGVRHDTARGGNISMSDQGAARDLAAAKAGLGSGKTLEAAQKGIARGAFLLLVLGPGLVIPRQPDPIKATATKIIVQSHLQNLSGTVIAGCTIRAMCF